MTWRESSKKKSGHHGQLPLTSYSLATDLFPINFHGQVLEYAVVVPIVARNDANAYEIWDTKHERGN